MEKPGGQALESGGSHWPGWGARGSGAPGRLLGEHCRSGWFRRAQRKPASGTHMARAQRISGDYPGGNKRNKARSDCLLFRQLTLHFLVRYKSGITLYVLFCLASFTQKCFEICPCCRYSTNSSFLSLAGYCSSIELY